MYTVHSKSSRTSARKKLRWRYLCETSVMIDQRSLAGRIRWLHSFLCTSDLVAFIPVMGVCASFLSKKIWNNEQTSYFMLNWKTRPQKRTKRLNLRYAMMKYDDCMIRSWISEWFTRFQAERVSTKEDERSDHPSSKISSSPR